MAMSIQQLREARTEKVKAAKNLLDQNTGENWTKDISAQVDKLYEQIDGYDQQIEAHEKSMKYEAELQNRIDRRADEDGTTEGKAQDSIEMEKEIFNSWMRHGKDSLNEKQQAYVEKRMRADQSVGTNSAGGYLVPRDFATTLIERMKDYSGLRELATVLQTDSGNTIDHPTVDETGVEGELVGENSSASSGDATFGTVAIGAYKFSSKVIAVPIELLMDNRVDLEGWITGALARRIARITNRMHTTGTGSSQPQGIVAAAGSGKVGATGQTTSVIWDDLVDLEHSVDPAYRENNPKAGYMFNDSTLKVLKKLKDGQNRPLWIPGMDKKDPATINGYQYKTNPNVASMAANAKSIIFGDYSQYVIRDIMQVTLQRFTDSVYATKGQVGFLAWYRGDGKVIAATASDVFKYYQNSAT